MDIRRSHTRESLLNKKVILLVAVLLALLVAITLIRQFGVGSGINKNGYQLVSLTTGERFIGKLSSTDGDYVTLHEVYYQQTTGAQKSETQDAAIETPGQITVAKLSSTVAKPEDTMRIASDKIVHWENLQDDSKIVEAIRQGTKD